MRAKSEKSTIQALIDGELREMMDVYGSSEEQALAFVLEMVECEEYDEVQTPREIRWAKAAIRARRRQRQGSLARGIMPPDRQVKEAGGNHRC